MNSTKQAALGRSALWLNIALALAFLMCHAEPARCQQWTTSGNNISNTNTGNVGIGTTTPGQKLTVTGAADTAVAIGDRGMAGSVGLQFLGTGYKHGAIRFDGDNLVVENASNTYLPSTWYNSQPMNFLVRNGNVGIGTTNPTRPLEVLAANGDAARLYRNSSNAGYGVNMKFALNNSAAAAVDYAGVHGQVGSNTAGAENGNLLFTTATGGALTEKMRIDGNGNVGVGATSPNYRLVVGPEMQSGLVHAAMTVSKGAGAGASIIVGSSGGTAAEFGWDNANTRAFFNSPGTTPMAFTQNGSNVRMFINSAGNVGIANGIIPLDAANKLTVDGNVHVTGNIAAKYQDVAEWVPSTQKLAAGTVVVLDTTASNHVVASTSAYDTGVAGVVSEQPGIILGEGGAGRVMVATTGRVKVRVDATRAPVRIGDLLVTGESPGVAMKSEPVTVGGRKMHAPGTIVGKALEPLEKGVGEILVLLSLQ